MKTFLRILGVIVTLVAAFVLIGFLLPRKIEVERSLVTSAPPEAIYPLVADLERWPDWQAWNKEMDPTVTYTFSDPSVGEGAWYEWKGEKLSTGRVALTGVETNRSVDYTVDFAGSGANPGTMEFVSVGKEPRTNVVWSFRCDMGFSPVGRYVGLMMRGMLEQDFDTGLANLKKLAEAGRATPVSTVSGTAVGSGTAGNGANGSTAAGDAPATDAASDSAERKREAETVNPASDSDPVLPASSGNASAEPIEASDDSRPSAPD